MEHVETVIGQVAEAITHVAAAVQQANSMAHDLDVIADSLVDMSKG